MSRPEIQERLLQNFVDMKSAASVAADSAVISEDAYSFHNGRVTAFAGCIRELEKAIEEAK